MMMYCKRQCIDLMVETRRRRPPEWCEGEELWIYLSSFGSALSASLPSSRNYVNRERWWWWYCKVLCFLL